LVQKISISEKIELERWTVGYDTIRGVVCQKSWKYQSWDKCFLAFPLGQRDMLVI